MTVYEMIQELSRYDANTEVIVNVAVEDYPFTATVSEDVKEGEETEVEVELDEDIEKFDIGECRDWRNEKRVRIAVTLK